MNQRFEVKQQQLVDIMVWADDDKNNDDHNKK